MQTYIKYSAHVPNSQANANERAREKEHERENESALTRRNEKAAWLSEEVKVQAIFNLNSIAIFHTHRSSYLMPMAWGLFDASILRFSTFYSPRFPVKYYERIFSLYALPLPCYSFFLFIHYFSNQINLVFFSIGFRLFALPFLSIDFIK